MVIDSTRKMVTSSVISRQTSVVIKLSTIAKIHKYKRLYEKHHFIPMAMEVHDAPKCDMDYFIKKYACLFHDR